MRAARILQVGALGVAFTLVLAACGASDGARAGSSTGSDVVVFQGDGDDTVIVTIRGDGSGKSSPTAAVPGANQTNPDWSPDGSRIVFVLADGSTDDLWTVGADGADPELLLSCDDPCLFLDDPAWSPDGASVMFARTAVIDDRRVATLESVNVASGEVEVWLTGPPTDFYSGVRYSPDGGQVVFEHVRSAGDELDSEILGVTLSILDLGDPAAGGREITDPALFAATADWGPNGDRIVYSALPKAGAPGADLFTIRPDGTQLLRLTTLTDDGGFANEPAWSADGSSVFFSGRVDGREGVLAKVPAGGGTVVPAFGKEYDVAGRHPRARAS